MTSEQALVTQEAQSVSGPSEIGNGAEGDGVGTSVARTEECRVQLPQFEGPLDLLLHLITKHELDILDIPMAFITEKYLAYLSWMQTLSIDLASEYLLMAATLAHIKSKMLLPEEPKDQEDAIDDEPLDPRAELVRRLLEYQKYKHAALDLMERSRLGVDVFERGHPLEEPTGPAPLEQVGVFALIDAFNGILKRKKISVDHEVNFDRISITQRIHELSDALRTAVRCTLDDLIPEGSSRADLIITFLALLEMTRLRLTRLTQSEALDVLYIELAVSDMSTETPTPEVEADYG